MRMVVFGRRPRKVKCLRPGAVRLNVDAQTCGHRLRRNGAQCGMAAAEEGWLRFGLRVKKFLQPRCEVPECLWHCSLKAGGMEDQPMQHVIAELGEARDMSLHLATSRRQVVRTLSGLFCQKWVHVSSAVTCKGPNTKASAASLVDTICHVVIRRVRFVKTCRCLYHVWPRFDSRGP